MTKNDETDFIFTLMGQSTFIPYTFGHVAIRAQNLKIGWKIMPDNPRNKNCAPMSQRSSVFCTISTNMVNNQCLRLVKTTASTLPAVVLNNNQSSIKTPFITMLSKLWSRWIIFAYMVTSIVFVIISAILACCMLEGWWIFSTISTQTQIQPLGPDSSFAFPINLFPRFYHFHLINIKSITRRIYEQI